MTKKTKPPSSGKGGKEGDANKKKSDTGPNKKGKGKDKSSPPKLKSRSSSARKRWELPVKTQGWDATLAKLQIQLNVGDKPETPESIVETTKKKTYCVKKYEKVFKKGETTYVVRRGALDDADVILWMPEKLDDLRFSSGLPVTYSILGTIADYLAAASEQNRDEEGKTDRFDSTLPKIKSRTRETGSYNLEYLTSFKLDPDKALETWENENMNRGNLGETIARKSKRPTSDLLMGNHPYRVANGQAKEFHDLESAWASEIRATQPNGFWKQEERLGDDLRGIHFTLTKTERGMPAEPEVVYRPGSGRLNQSDSILDLTVKNGMSSPFSDKKTFNLDHPSPLTSPMPETIEVGSGEPIIAIGDRILTWSTRDSVVNDLELGILTTPGQTNIGKLTIVNIGTCVIRFELFKIPKAEDPEISISRQARDKMGLFVDDSPGIILPGDYQSISAIFYCRRAAIFSEHWLLVTAPKLAKEITINVWGIAKDVKQLGQDGDEIEREIEEKCLSHFMRNILEDVLNLVFWVPPPKRTEGFPEHVDPKWFQTILGRDLFALTNPGHVYRSESVAKIIEIAEVSLPEYTFDKWSLPLSTIRDSLLNLPEEVKLQKQDLLPKNEVANAFLTHVRALTFEVDFPVTNRKYSMCKMVLLEVCNTICDTATRIKKAHGITLDMNFEIELPKEEPKPETVIMPTSPPKGRMKSPPKSYSRDTKNKKKQTLQKSSTPSSPTSPKSSRFSKIVKGISAAMKAQYKNRARPIMYMKYLEKLNISGFIIVRNYIDTISGFLADLPEVEKLRL